MPSNWDTAALRVSHLAARGEPTNRADLVDVGEAVLQGSHHIDAGHDHRGDAERLFAAACPGVTDDLSRLTKRQRDRYLALVARRAAGEPLGHLLGYVEFGPLVLQVRRGAFVPRPASVRTAQRAVELVSRVEHPIVVDVGTGIGAMALAVARAVPHAEVWGTDISAVACAQARHNAKRLAIPNARFRLGDTFDPLPGRLRRQVDVIVGYVPYLTNEDIVTLQAEIGTYEPLHALTDLSEDGFELVRRIATGAMTWLREGGRLLVQIDAETGPRLATTLTDAGLGDVQQTGHQGAWDVVVEGTARHRTD